MVVPRQLIGSGVCSPASTICPPSSFMKRRSFEFSASIYRSESLRRGHPSGSSLTQSSIATTALPTPSWCLVMSLRDEVTLTGRVFLRPRSEQRLFAPSLVFWCQAFAMGSPLSGRVAYFYALDRNEGLFCPPILNYFAMGSLYGSSVAFLPIRSEQSPLWIAGRYSFRMGSTFSGQVLAT